MSIEVLQEDSILERGVDEKQMKNIFRFYSMFCFILIFGSGCDKKSTPSCKEAKNSILITRDFYSLCFDTKTKQPTWVVQLANSDSFRVSSNGSLESYRPDPDIPVEKQTMTKDYEDSQWVIGNYLFSLAQFEEAVSEKKQTDRFLFSVTSPQDAGFHKGYWRKLRNRVMELVRAKDNDLFDHKVAILSGPLFLLEKQTSEGVMGNNHIPVPTHFFQVILPTADPDDIEIYIVPNENINTSKPLSDFKTSLKEFEKKSGIQGVKNIVRWLVNPVMIL